MERTKQAQKAFDQLKEIGAPVIDRCDEDGYFIISAEHGARDDGLPWADYYETVTLDNKLGYRFGVHPDIVSILDKNGLFAEWANPGFLGVWN